MMTWGFLKLLKQSADRYSGLATIAAVITVSVALNSALYGWTTDAPIPSATTEQPPSSQSDAVSSSNTDTPASADSSETKQAAKDTKPAEEKTTQATLEADPAEQTSPDTEQTASTTPQQGEVHVEEAGAADYDFLRHLIIPLNGYTVGTSLPTKWKQSSQVVPLLLQNRNLALHLEILRQATLQLSPTEQRKLATALHAEHRKIPDDPYRFFDVGYTEWVIMHDKSALFYLRKANDQLQNPWSSLAYALAQAEADITHERALPGELTRRKQDAMFKLTDALTYQAKAPVSGFWPAYLRAMDALKPVPAYTDFTQTDRTDVLIPFGNSVSVEYSLPEFDTSEDDTPTCQRPLLNSIAPKLSNATRTVSLYLNQQAETPDGVYFLKADVTTEPGQSTPGYEVVVRRGNQVLADIKTPVGPYIFEDLDQDGTPEIVLRQFSHNRTQPVRVYRFNGCQFEADTDLISLFE